MEHKPIVCLALPAWKGDYAKSTVELISALAAWHPILYVDYTFTWKDVLKHFVGQKKHMPLKRMLGLKKACRQVQTRQGHQIWLLSPFPIFPVNALREGLLYRFFMSLNAALLVWQIRRWMKRLGMNDPVFLNAFQPGLGNRMLGRLNESSSFYYCYDEISAARWAGKHGKREEQHFMKRVDAVLVSSPGLLKNKMPYAQRIGKVYNGVDFELFHQAFRRTLPSKFTVGYVGTIDERLDFELCEALFQQQPEVKFQFVGRVLHDRAKGWSAKFPNVKMMGSFSTNELPFYIKEFRCAIIPFVENEFTQSIYPLKINEYLAAGIPVVSTQFTDLQEFENVAHLCSTSTQFVDQVMACLMHPDEERRVLGLAHALQCDWQARAKQLQNHLFER